MFRNFKWQLGPHWAVVSINRCFAFIHSLLTAIHSLRSSPSGSMTACRRFPLPSVASACFSSSYWWEPSGMFFFGLKVLDERLPLQRKQTWSWAFVWASRTVTFKKNKKKKHVKACVGVHAPLGPPYMWGAFLSGLVHSAAGGKALWGTSMDLMLKWYSWCAQTVLVPSCLGVFSAWETCDCIICVM